MGSNPTPGTAIALVNSKNAGRNRLHGHKLVNQLAHHRYRVRKTRHHMADGVYVHPSATVAPSTTHVTRIPDPAIWASSPQAGQRFVSNTLAGVEIGAQGADASLTEERP